ncbi:rhamnogalacturonan acetylesterase [Streptomyces sp. NBC_00335]|uniref:rhamnogalacturonan acetylesterase n=1 Tax=unclassified Streptomyces TaxID=2593676 RepID=UPI00224E20C1|nr:MULTISPECIES: rhamnogalacturonan acetylesterase [unclassified Streptomyces]MCX5403237.1 rhamnogalacturonan acetylesterase [Streptomyces sp. NBC_00086]
MTFTRRRAVTAGAGLALALAAAPAVTATPAAAVPRGKGCGRTLYIAGDSTAAQKYADAAPETGWGMALPFFLHRDVTVANHAVNGRSTKSFIDEGRLTAILDVIRPGDLLLIQFGHNDQKTTDPTRYTEPWTTYQDNLGRFVDGARECGALPVLATSVERRRFDAEGTALRTHGDYPAAMRQVAAEEDVAVIDVQEQSLALWQELGPETTKTYFNWTATEQDNTHFNPPGAIAVARMVATGLLHARALAPGDTRRTDEEVPAQWITWPDSEES